jgi:geranylgeranyl pyrophosphate synthase
MSFYAQRLSPNLKVTNTSEGAIFYSHSLTHLASSGRLFRVIDNPANLQKNVIRGAQLPLLAEHLPTSARTGVDTPGIDSALLVPVREFVSRDSKQVRAQLVRIGYSLATTKPVSPRPEQEKLLDCMACVVEALHAGSLMIDDIQDADELRRGKAALHMQIGVPRTINAANWLYFWPTDLLRQQTLEPAMELEIYRLFHKTMMRAHQGQALDLGHDMTQTSQAEVLEISIAAIELKTGELTAMCSELGAIVGNAEPTRRRLLATLGQRFGVALQMFNDIGEVFSKIKNDQALRPLLRPSWVWAVAARELSSEEFSKFQTIMGGLCTTGTIVNQIVKRATELATVEFENCLDEIDSLVKTDGHMLAQQSLRDLAQKVMSAYA